jgi:uncharacterized protein
MPRIASSPSTSRRRVPTARGERVLQEQYGTTARAGAFYSNQMLDHLNDAMRGFLERMDMVFVSTADAEGACDSSFRAGPAGFFHVLDDRTLAYAEYRGNGVMASLGNLQENPHIGLMFLDFFRDKIGLHINGRAALVSPEEFGQRPDSTIAADQSRSFTDRQVELWVVVDVDEAYIHCSKHIPLLRKATAQASVPRGADETVVKRGDYFKAASNRRAAADKARVRGNPEMPPEELVCIDPAAAARTSRRSA